jgi:hypothetical protein
MRFGSEARFTSDPRPINIEFLRVPRLEDRLVLAPLRGWVADIADVGARTRCCGDSLTGMTENP